MLFWLCFVLAYGETKTQLALKDLVHFDAGEVMLPVDMTADDKGRLFVADQGAHQIHIWNADGSVLTQIGDRGEGPGEFTFLSFPLIEYDDTNEQLIVVDDSVFNYFDGDDFEFKHRKRAPFEDIFWFDVISSNRYLIEFLYLEQKRKKYISKMAIVDADFNVVHELGEIVDAYYRTRNNGDLIVRPWGSRFAVAQGAAGLVLGVSSEPSLKYFDNQGFLERTLAVPLLEQEITRDEINDIRRIYYKDFGGRMETEENRYFNRLIYIDQNILLMAVYRHGDGLWRGSLVDTQTGDVVGAYTHAFGERGGLFNIDGSHFIVTADEDGDWRITRVKPILDPPPINP